jgi:hypothetical protein
MESLVTGNADVMSTSLVDVNGETLAAAGDHATF